MAELKRQTPGSASRNDAQRRTVDLGLRGPTAPATIRGSFLCREKLHPELWCCCHDPHLQNGCFVSTSHPDLTQFPNHFHTASERGPESHPNPSYEGVGKCSGQCPGSAGRNGTQKERAHDNVGSMGVAGSLGSEMHTSPLWPSILQPVKMEIRPTLEN